MSAVCEFWFRILAVWTRIFTMSLLSTCEMYRSRPFPFRTCHRLVSSGHLRSLVTWAGASRNRMRAAAKQRFRQSRPSSCVYYGIWIKCNMYRHVARFHLDLAQLWRCPVSWCTVWKGTPQDCMDHVWGAHVVLVGCLQRSCASPLFGSRFRRMRCRMWCRPTVFNGRHITWLPWDCGVHPVRRVV